VICNESRGFPNSAQLRGIATSFKCQVARIVLAAGIPGIMESWAQGIAYQIIYNAPGSYPALERAWGRSAYRSAFPPANWSCADEDDLPDVMTWRRR
jgi:hypothetical protein